MRAAEPVGHLPFISPALGKTNRQNVKFAKMAPNHLQEPRDIKITQCKHEVGPFLFILFSTRTI